MRRVVQVVCRSCCRLNRTMDRRKRCVSHTWSSVAGADTQQFTRLTNLLLPFSKIYDLLLRLPRLGDASAPTPEGDSYTPWTPPPFPSPPTIHQLPLPSAPSATTFQVLTPPPYPRPFPSVRQVVHHPETGVALLLSNTLVEEGEERQREEREVQVRRKRLGAGSEREVRRAVGRDVLGSSNVGFRLRRGCLGTWWVG